MTLLVLAEDGSMLPLQLPGRLLESVKDKEARGAIAGEIADLSRAGSKEG